MRIREYLTLGERLYIEKVIPYISPSSLMKMDKQPNTFFLERLCLVPMQKSKQIQAAANGSAFDYFVKKKIFSEQGRNYREEDLLASIEIEDRQSKERALNIGNIFYTSYCELIKKIPISWNFFNDVEIDKTFVFHEIPFRGKLDCIYISEKYKKAVPMDWKVIGSESHSSPTPKYWKMISISEDKQHKDFKENLPFEEIDEAWATQLCIYGWEIGWDFKEFEAQIHELTLTEKGIIRLSIFKGIITIDFQKKIFNKAKIFWEAINDGRYLYTLASQHSKNMIYLASFSESWF